MLCLSLATHLYNMVCVWVCMCAGGVFVFLRLLQTKHVNLNSHTKIHYSTEYIYIKILSFGVAAPKWNERKKHSRIRE